MGRTKPFNEHWLDKGRRAGAYDKKHPGGQIAWAWTEASEGITFRPDELYEDARRLFYVGYAQTKEAGR